MRMPRSAITLSLPLWLLAAGAADAAGTNQLTIQVANGPYAGAYHSEANSTICFKAKVQDVFSSAWKDFNADGRKLAEAGVEVQHPDVPGPKHGRMRISFGKDGNSAIYEILNQPLTVTPLADGARINGEGTTSTGIRITLEAVCEDVETV